MGTCSFKSPLDQKTKNANHHFTHPVSCFKSPPSKFNPPRNQWERRVVEDVTFVTNWPPLVLYALNR